MTGAIYSLFGFALFGCVGARLNDALPTCPPADFTSDQNFDLKAFIKTRWYIQQQMAVSYLPKSENRCVYAEYKLLNPKSLLGYDVQVHNYAEDVAPPHAAHDSGTKICAAIVDAATGKLEVAPCFLPKVTSGDYWVIDFSDADGYALISGGPPTKAAAGGCQTGTGINGSGLWIFTRQQARDQSIVDKVRSIAKAKGFDLSVLNDVDQTGCKVEKEVVV